MEDLFSNVTGSSVSSTTEVDEDIALLRSERRSLTLAPDLVNKPCSEDWAFALKSCFRTALDIQWTSLQKKKVKYQVWTQGQNYAFSQGDTIYDTMMGYEPWLTALQHLSTSLTVLSARPALPKDGIAGEVSFIARHPNEDRSGLSAGSEHTCTQSEFVELLRTGFLNGTRHNDL